MTEKTSQRERNAVRKNSRGLSSGAEKMFANRWERLGSCSRPRFDLSRFRLCSLQTKIEKDFEFEIEGNANWAGTGRGA